MFLKSPRCEESLTTGRTEESSRHLLLRLVSVEGNHVSLQVGRHPHPLPTQVTVGVLGLCVFHHVKLQLMLEVKHLLTNLAVQLGSDLVFGSDVNVASSSLGVSLLTDGTLKLSVYLQWYVSLKGRVLLTIL